MVNCTATMVTFDELDFTDAGKSLKYVFNIFIIFVSEILGTEITRSKIEKKKKIHTKDNFSLTKTSV